MSYEFYDALRWYKKRQKKLAKKLGKGKVTPWFTVIGDKTVGSEYWRRDEYNLDANTPPWDG